MPKSFEEKVRQEVNRRMEIYRRNHSQQEIRVGKMSLGDRINYEVTEMVKHTTWMQENGLAMWAILGMDNTEYIALCLQRSSFSLEPVDDTGGMELKYTGSSGTHIQQQVSTPSVEKAINPQALAIRHLPKNPFVFNQYGLLQAVKYDTKPRTS